VVIIRSRCVGSGQGPAAQADTEENAVRNSRSVRFLAILAAVALLVPALAQHAVASTQHKSLGTASIFGSWASAEKTDFLAILSYCDSHYNIKANYEQASGDLATELSTRVQGGNPPDLATLSTPSSIAQYVAGNSLTPLDFLNNGTFQSQYAPFWRNLGTINGKLYAIYMKADVKSLIWYSPKKFKAGHYKIPKTWNQLLALSAKMVKSGKHPWAFGVGGSPASPWTLTDFLENVVLQEQGPGFYQKWIDHKVSWKSPQLKHAFATMAKIIGNNAMLAGGRSRALSQAWDQAAVQVVNDPQAEFFQEATFVAAGLAGDLPKAKAGKDFSAFPFPNIGKWKTTPVEVGPNGVVMFKDTPASRALMKCLVDPNALAQWAKKGGFISPNNSTPPSAYPDALTRANAQLMIKAGKAKLLVGDASDLMPVALGSNFEFTALQKWFKNPSSTDSVLADLENEAKKDYK
jgi:alpha-glucoside transport system substrate-binding protein